MFLTVKYTSNMGACYTGLAYRQSVSLFPSYLASTGFSFVFSATTALFAIQLTGYLSGAEIIAQTWGGALIYQLILVYALCQGIIDCGAGDVIARYLITRKWRRANRCFFHLMLQIASIFSGAFLGLGVHSVLL